MPETVLLRNCTLYNAPTGTPTQDLLIRDGAIAALGESFPAENAAEVLDVSGRVLIPGLIDIHLHGAGGADLLDGTPDTLGTISRTLARLGTTGFVGTSVPRPEEGNRHLAAAAAGIAEGLDGARCHGLYLEGPFINPDKRGGIPREAIQPCSPAALEEILALSDGTLRIMTVAPELPGAVGLVERLTAAGVIPSFGHSAATYQDTRTGIEAGIRHATHLFNAMAGLHHREPGPIPALLEADQLPVELISDDVHVSSPMVRFATRAFGAERLVLITDAMRATGLPDGRYRYGDREFEARDGAGRYLDGTLIGTSLGLLEIALRFQRYTGCTLAEAVDAASLAPARVLGIDHQTGSIQPGKDADLVVLDEDRSVWATVVGGRVAYRKEEGNGGVGR